MSQYWIGDDSGRVLGPLTLKALRDVVASGRLKAATRASRDGYTWEPLQQFKEVKDLLGAAPVATTSAEQEQVARLRQQLESLRPLPPHRLFNVKPFASLEELRSAFFQMARRYAAESLPPDASPEVRRVSEEIYELLAQRMRDAEALYSRSTQRPATASAPAPATATPAGATPDTGSRPAYTYASREFTGLRRSSDRIKLELRITPGNRDVFTAHPLVNLGTNGLFIPTDRPLRLGTEVDLTLRFERPEREVVVQTKVIWEYAQTDGKQPRGYGLTLAPLTPEERAFVDSFVRGRAG